MLLSNWLPVLVDHYVSGAFQEDSIVHTSANRTIRRIIKEEGTVLLTGIRMSRTMCHMKRFLAELEARLFRDSLGSTQSRSLVDTEYAVQLL